MRGEHTYTGWPKIIAMGSSPHARGAQRHHPWAGQIDGIIPACAGSTSRVKLRFERSEDHPRMRGEHAVVPSNVAPFRGSSPHARGAHPGR